MFRFSTYAWPCLLLLVCYLITGTVIGDHDVGGLVGDNDGTISKCFWDIQTSELFSSDGGSGLTTEQIQDISIYINAGWDIFGETYNGTCDYWQVSDGNYPQLSYFIGSGPLMPEGLGTVQQPYLIRDVSDLGSIYIKPNAHYRLESSLDISDITWSTAVIPNFDGTFDGNGYIISNLSIEGDAYLGLFGQLGSEAMVYNLGLETVDVKGIGVLACSLVVDNNGSVSNCYSTGTVYGDHTVGGLGGNGYIGGLLGRNQNGYIAMSYSIGPVIGDYIVGGFMGENDGDVSNCYSTGGVTGNWNVGGLAGINDGDVWDCYSNNAVHGFQEIGGLIGRNKSNGYVANCYSRGEVLGSNDVGGLVGRNSIGSINSSFWDIETSGQTLSAGGTGLITAEMQTAANFLEAGWDFKFETDNGTEDIWWILEGQDYPRLWWELIPEN
jgi:hypothetical protein